MVRRCLLLFALSVLIPGCAAKHAPAPKPPRTKAKMAMRLPAARIVEIEQAVVHGTAPRATGGPADVLGVTPFGLAARERTVWETSDHATRVSRDGGHTWKAPSASTHLPGPAFTKNPRYIRVDGRLRKLPFGATIPQVAFTDATSGFIAEDSVTCDDRKAPPAPAWTTRDGGRTWQGATPLPRMVSQAGDVAESGNLLVVAGDCDFRAGTSGYTRPYPTIAISADNGRHWSAQRLPTSDFGCKTSAVGFVVWLLCGETVYRSADAGRTWHAFVFPRLRFDTEAPSAIAAVGPSIAVGMPVRGGALLRTVDGGHNWTLRWPAAGHCSTGVPSEIGGGGATARCLGIPQRYTHSGDGTSIWRMNRTTYLVGNVTTGRYDYRYRVLRRVRDGWRVIFDRGAGSPAGAAAFDDVNGDGRLDALIVSDGGGSGVCAGKDVVSLGRTPVRLFHGESCERESELKDGHLRFRETIGPCPDRFNGAHCFGGVRTTVLRWHGTRVISRRRFVTCVDRRLDPRNHCRKR